MAKIYLNNIGFDFDNYNRNTYFSDDTITSNAYIGNIRGENLATTLQELGTSTITSIAIEKDETIIYNLTNIHAKITNIDESFNGSDNVYTNVNLQFN